MKTTTRRPAKQLGVSLLVRPSAETGYEGIVSIDGTGYDLTPVPSDWGLAYRLRRHGVTGEGLANGVYDVLVEDTGEAHCDCPGHTRWGHCKHVAALRTLAAEGLLPLPTLPAHEWGEEPAGQQFPDDAASYKPGHSGDFPF